MGFSERKNVVWALQNQAWDVQNAANVLAEQDS